MDSSIALLLTLATLIPITAAAGEQQSWQPPHVYGKVTVLSVGIERYQHGGRPALGAENDAAKLSQTLKERYGYTPEILLGKDATRKAILNKLSECALKAAPNDVLIFFFAGHGQVINLPENHREGFLIPYDAEIDLDDHRDAAKWQQEALDMRQLSETLLKTKAKHVLLICDACFSGFMTQRGSFSVRGDLQKLLDSPSRMVLTATTDQEKAFGKNHGIFTESLIDVLKTNQPLCVTDVLLEVRKRVMRVSSGAMTPTMGRIGNDNGSGELVFLPSSLDANEVKRAVDDARRQVKSDSRLLDGIRQRAIERQNLQATMKDVVDAFESPDYRFADAAADKGREWERRFNRLQESASCGDVLAMIAMHYCCAKGLGCDKDPNAAFRWAKLAFDTGHSGGKHVLGRSLNYGIGTSKNERAGLKLIREASEKPMPFAISLLQIAVDQCNEGRIAEADSTLLAAQKEEIWQASVFRGDLYLGINPGGGYLKDVKPDPEAAISVLLPAAQHGNVEAQFLLAHSYAWNESESGLLKARDWLERAAQNGSAAAQGQLARELTNGVLWPIVGELPLNLGLKRDDKKGLQFARLAAEQGDAAANVILACDYENRREYEKAIMHCDKALESNHPCAMVLKSMWYSTNKVFPKSTEEAARWALRAEPSGDPTAFIWIGCLYLDGAMPKLKNTDVSGGKLITWHHGAHYFTRAATKGSAHGKKLTKELITELPGHPTPTQWSFFVRDYPQDVKPFCEITGFQPPLRQ